MTKKDLIAHLKNFDDNAIIHVIKEDAHYEDNYEVVDVMQVTTKTGKTEVNLIF